MRKLRIKVGEGLVGAAMANNEPVIVEDIAVDPRSSMRIRRALFPAGDDAGAHALVVPMTDEHDSPIGALGVVREAVDDEFATDEVDLLRLIALNASTGFQLQSARETRQREERLTTIGSLLSGVMHDLKTPMTVIRGYVQMMASEGEAAVRAELAEAVVRQFEHVSAMQKEVLDFARGERTMLVRKIYLAKFFGELEAQLQREIERRSVPVKLALVLGDRGTARFDEAKVTRAVHNLARNAIEAMSESGGTLTISVERGSAGEVIVSVGDTGPGLPREVQERLFQSFVTSGKPTGTGLGLAIVKKIVDDHGGVITASTSPEGTTFRFTLPQPAARATTSDGTPSPTA
jgi:signal transduction histidine kinase